MPLPGDQNSADSIRLLSAFSYEYSRAKWIRWFRVFVSIGIALAAPIASVGIPQATNLRNFLAIAGGGWLLLSSLILKKIENVWIKRAAVIQEEFDSKILDLPWNKIFVGDHVSKELINHADAKYKCKRKRERLRNWYPNTDPIKYPINVLLCQRACLVWDWRQRKSYSYFIGLMTGLFFLGGVVTSVTTDQKMLDYILRIFSPSLALIVLGVETAWANYDMGSSKEKKEKMVNGMLEKVTKEPGSLTVEDCRRLQDYIFSLRSTDTVVPNWWYGIFRKSYDPEMRQAVEEFKKEPRKQ